MPSKPLFLLAVFELDLRGFAVLKTSMLSLSRQVFSAQDGSRKKIKTCPEPSGNELSAYVFENSVRCL